VASNGHPYRDGLFGLSTQPVSVATPRRYSAFVLALTAALAADDMPSGFTDSTAK
jgi:hypothetical protein